MTRASRGKLAVLGLGLVLGSFVLALATTRAARIRWLAWRARSSDREVRLRARTELMAIGRPAIDPVFAGLVAGEVADRLEPVTPSERTVAVARIFPPFPFAFYKGATFSMGYRVERHVVARELAGDWYPADYEVKDDLAVSLCPGSDPERRVILVVAQKDPGEILDQRLAVELVAGDPLEATILEETRARVEALK